MGAAGAIPGTGLCRKTFHALGREILADGESVEPLLDREAVFRDTRPDITRGAVRRLDDALAG